MILINVMLDGMQQPVSLRYRKGGGAHKVYDRLCTIQEKQDNSIGDFEDEFGVRIRFLGYQLRTFLMIDLEAGTVGDTEVKMIGARGERELQKRAQAEFSGGGILVPNGGVPPGIRRS